MELKELEHTIEGILFAAGDPVPMSRMATSLEQDVETVERVCCKLADGYRYHRRGICLVRTEDSWQMCTAPEYASAVRGTLEHRKPPKLSPTALEVLAIVAYFQPVTRAYIEQIRGVDSAYTVGLLLERELIEEAGRLAVPGRPMQFRTTQNFLRTFGLTSLEELPDLPAPGQTGVQMSMNLGAAEAGVQGEETEEAEET